MQKKRKQTAKQLSFRDGLSQFFGQYSIKLSGEIIFIIIVLAIGFVLRIHHALTTEYVVHNDELMQYLERAQLLLFDSGIIRTEQVLSMRSLIVPSFVAFWMWLCNVLGVGTSFIYIPTVKIVFVCLSMAIPVGAYRLSRYFYGPGVAMVALVFVSLWYQIVYWSHKPLTSVVATSLVFLCLSWQFSEKPSKEKSTLKIWAIGLILTLALAIRIQYAPLCFLIFCYVFFSFGTARARWYFVLVCFVGVMLFMGAFDWITLGYPFQANYNNIFYNVIQGMASSMGVAPFHQYLMWMAEAYYFLLWMALGFALFRLF